MVLGIVVDTNVLISATFWKGDSYKILKLVEENKIKLYLSHFILKEYESVLFSEEIITKRKLKSLDVLPLISSIIRLAIIVVPKKIPKIIFADPDDDNILATAKTANINFLISQDKHLLNLSCYNKIQILTPKQFLDYDNQNPYKDV